MEQKQNSFDSPESKKSSWKRKVFGSILGFWLAISVLSGFEKGIVYMFPDRYSIDISPWPDHFVLFLLLAAIAIFVGTFVAGLAARTKGGFLSALIALLLFVGYAFFWLFLWAPDVSPTGQVLFPLSFWNLEALIIPFWLYALVMLVLFVGAGIIGGTLGQNVAEEEEYDVDPKRKSLFNIWWVHWLWLWLPIQYFALDSLRFGYTLWLDLVLGWHWLFHPSLWLSWKWWLWFGFGLGFSSIPMGLLLLGYGKAFDVLSEGWGRGLRWWSVAWRFLAFWLLVPMGANIVNAIVLWIFSNLPVVLPEGGRPWWILF